MRSKISAHDFLSHLNHFWASLFNYWLEERVSWSDSAYDSKVKLSTSTSCVYSCVSTCMSAKRSTFQKQTINQALCIVSIWALKPEFGHWQVKKTQTFIFSSGCFYNWLLFNILSSIYPFLSGSGRRKEQEGGAQLSGREKQLQIGKQLQIEPDIDSRWWGTAERGKCMFQARLFFVKRNNRWGSGNIIREKKWRISFQMRWTDFRKKQKSIMSKTDVFGQRASESKIDICKFRVGWSTIMQGVPYTQYFYICICICKTLKLYLYICICWSTIMQGVQCTQ